MTPAQIAALTTELNNDPRSYGYAADIAAGRDQDLANKLNLPRDGNNGGPAITVRRSDLVIGEVLEVIDTRDFVASPTSAQLAYFQALSASRTISLLNADGSNTRILRNLRDVLQNPGPQGSRARIDAVANKIGSRAEELFGTNTVATITDVAVALGRG